MTLGMCIKLTKNWLSSQQRQRVLEKEKLETELKFLRSQFNPHFLFNTINSIFVLINKNTEMATESLVKFSNLLRYQLYECNEQTILLSKEITYVESFIELEKLRQNDNFSLNCTFPDRVMDDFSIAPFLLMPFIENAFKHISQYDDRANTIIIRISFEEENFVFEVENTISNTINSAKSAVSYQGLGLKNVKRRLILLYPDDHNLQIQQSKEWYKIKLCLALDVLKTPKLNMYSV